MPKLTIVEHGTQTVYELFEDQHDVSVGRGAASAVQIQDTHASKHHAAIRRIGARWKCVDLESKNGMRVNGAFRNQHWLTDGDTIAIGDALISYADEAVAAGAPAQVVSAPGFVAPAAAVPVVAAPSRLPAAPSAAPAVEAGAAPAPSRASPSRAASRARDRDDGDDYDDDDRGPTRRRDDKGPMIALLAIVGIGIFVFLMITMLKPTEYKNQTVRVYAADLANRGDPAGAIEYAERNGRPDEPFWHDLKREIDNWKEQLEMVPRLARNKEAAFWFETNIVRRSRTSMHRAKGAMSREETASVLKEFLAMYGDTPTAKQLLYSKVAPYTEFRDMMMENASDEGDPGRILALIRNEIESLTKRRKFGEAVARLEDVRATQQVLLSRERAEEVRRLVDSQIAEVKREARRSFERDMEKVDSYMRDDKRASARYHLEDMIDTYGLPNLVNEAKLKLDDL